MTTVYCIQKLEHRNVNVHVRFQRRAGGRGLHESECITEEDSLAKKLSVERGHNQHSPGLLRHVIIGRNRGRLSGGFTMRNLDRRVDYLNGKIEGVFENANLLRSQAVSDFNADIRSMLNNSNYSDVTFLCTDGGQVHASRLFLAARSVFFRGMLLSDMAKFQLRTITLHEVSSASLLSVMEFLYTGSLLEQAPKDCKHAFEILRAAKFFMLEGLELIMVDYLLRAAGEVGVDTEAAFKFLSIAVEFVNQSDEILDLVACELLWVLKSTPWKPEQMHALIGSAFLYFLEKTKTKDALRRFVTRVEGGRLKKIIIWCACHEFSAKQAIPPEVSLALELLQYPSLLSRDSEVSRRFKAYKEIQLGLACSIKQYLPLVNFRRISPHDLEHVFRPLDIVPSAILTDALQFRTHDPPGRPRLGFGLPLVPIHERKPPLIVEDDVDFWSSNNEEIYEVGRVRSIQQTAAGIGFASYGFGIVTDWDHRFFRWDIIIERVCDSFVEIGFYDPSRRPTEHSLSGQRGGFALRMDPQGLSIYRKGERDTRRDYPSFVPLIYGKDYAQKNSKVSFSFHPHSARCFFAIDSDDFGPAPAWSFLSDPRGSIFYYPAVSLGTGAGGKVQIKILGLND